MTDKEYQKAFHTGYIAALVTAKAHHMKLTGKWDYINPEEFKGHVSDEKMKELEADKDTPYCNVCGESALFKQLEDDTYAYCLSNYCPKCGAILNEEIANKTPEDSIAEQVEEINGLYNSIRDDLDRAKESGDLDI